MMVMDRRGEYERVFNRFDRNRDGKISPVELQQCIESIRGYVLAIGDAEALVWSVDSDGDGLLSLDEFIQAVEVGAEEEKAGDLKEVFRMYELEEGCGCITPKSLKRMLSRLGESRTVDECELMIASFDGNGDGVLNFDEFRDMMA